MRSTRSTKIPLSFIASYSRQQTVACCKEREEAHNRPRFTMDWEWWLAGCPSPPHSLMMPTSWPFFTEHTYIQEDSSRAWSQFQYSVSDFAAAETGASISFPRECCGSMCQHNLSPLAFPWCQHWRHWLRPLLPLQKQQQLELEMFQMSVVVHLLVWEEGRDKF